MKCAIHPDSDAVALLEREHKKKRVSIGACEKCFEVYAKESGFRKPNRRMPPCGTLLKN